MDRGESKMNKIVLTLLVSTLLFTSGIAEKLVFGGDNAYPPYEFVDKNGEPTGFNVDLMRAVADSAELDIEIELGEWNNVVEKLQSGELNGLLGMAVTPERQKIYSFSIPHNTLHMGIFYRKGQKETTVEDLFGKEIVVQRNGKRRLRSSQ